MKLTDLETFLTELPDVEREENFGYLFFFVGDDHRLPFTTIGIADNEFDKVSNLDREGVFRLNIGVSKETFENLIGDSDSEDGDGVEEVDYSVLNVFLPHPHYARQSWVSILNPEGHNADEAKRLILEAHSIADRRMRRKAKG